MAPQLTHDKSQRLYGAFEALLDLDTIYTLATSYVFFPQKYLHSSLLLTPSSALMIYFITFILVRDQLEKQKPH